MPQLTIKTNADGVPVLHSISGDYFDRLAQVESSGNPNAKATGSSAKGLYQFTDATAKRYGLTNPYDPVASRAAAESLTSDNAAALRKGLGRDPSEGELYLAHQQGAGGALKLINNPDSSAVSLLGKKRVLSNGGSADMTASDFANTWIKKFEGVAQSPAVKTALHLVPALGTAASLGAPMVEGAIRGGAGLLDYAHEASQGRMFGPEDSPKLMTDMASIAPIGATSVPEGGLGAMGGKFGVGGGQFSISEVGKAVDHLTEVSGKKMLVHYAMKKLPNGGMSADVGFAKEGTKIGFPSFSMKSGVDTMATLLDSVELFVKRAKPAILTFSPATTKLERVYSSVAPKLAEKLGGVLEKHTNVGPQKKTYYSISLPNPHPY